MILAFRPLIGIIVGVVIALTVAAVGLVVVLRCRANGSNRQSKLSTQANEKDSVGSGPDEKPLAVLLKKDPLAMGEELELDCKGPDIIPMRKNPAGTLSKKGLSDYVNLEGLGGNLAIDSRYSTILPGRSDGVDPSQTALTTQLAQDILLSNNGLGTGVDTSQTSSLTADYSELVFARSIVALPPPGHPDPLGPPTAPTQPLPPVGGTLGRRGHTTPGSKGKLPPTEFARIDFHRTLRPVPGQHLLAAAEDHSAYPIVGDIDPSMAIEANS
ncbi:hemicentin-1-like, partial [Tropilaelaps mercedesae]